MLADLSWRNRGVTHDELAVSEEGFDKGTVVKLEGRICECTHSDPSFVCAAAC